MSEHDNAHAATDAPEPVETEEQTTKPPPPTPADSAAEAKKKPPAKPGSQQPTTVEELMKSLDLELAPVRPIRVEELHARRDRIEDEEEFEALVANLKVTRAVWVPLWVHFNPSTKKFAVVDGRRRFFAAQAVRREAEGLFGELQCVEILGRCDEATLELIAHLLNRHRLQEKPIDLALRLRRQKERTKLNGEELAAVYGLSAGTVSELLRAAEMPEEYLARAKAGENLFKVFREYRETLERAVGSPGRARKQKARTQEHWLFADEQTGLVVAVRSEATEAPGKEAIEGALERARKSLKKSK